MYAKGKIVGANVSSRNVRLGGTRSIWPLQAHRAGITPAVGVITARRAERGDDMSMPTLSLARRASMGGPSALHVSAAG